MSVHSLSPLILIVDDEAANLQLLRQILQNDYRMVFAKDGARALELAKLEQPDLILLDVMMPGMTGYDTCRQLKQHAATASTPVIFVTALHETSDEIEGFSAGAVDYITKPVSAPVVKARIRTHLSLVHLDEVKKTRLQVVQRLGLAAEYKDNETGMHVIRMSHYARILGLAAGMNEQQADDLLNAAPMHDVGKIGIPDQILQKPGPLTTEEMQVMRSHVAIGGKIIGEGHDGLLGMAYRIATTHHEKWDGTGYPAGLKGEQIPLEGRIAAVVDVFDALTTVRPYKKAWPEAQALAYLVEQRGQHFDPALVDLFLANMGAIREIQQRWPEDGASGSLTAALA